MLASAAIYEAALVLGLLSGGGRPGQDPPSSDAVELAALLAMLAGSLLAVVLGLEIRFVGLQAAWLAPAGAAFVVARYYTYDSYYWPEGRRISDVERAGGDTAGFSSVHSFLTAS